MKGSAMTVRRIFPLILLLALASTAAGAQTVDEILEKHAAAHGGVEKWRAVRSMIVTGTQVIFSEPSPFVYEWRRPDSSRFEQSMLGQKVTYVHDGSTTWWIHPLLLENEQPAAVPAEAAAAVRRAVDFESPLVDAKAKGHKVELLGKDAVDGQPALKLKVTRKDGTEETWYLDPSTYLEMARFDRTIDLPQTHDRWTWFSDFRTVDGLVIPHQQEQEYSIRNVSVTVEKVRINPEIDAGRFTMPAVEKKTEGEGKPGE
jgi:outer membrane lipoprotein-sorting protein